MKLVLIFLATFVVLSHQQLIQIPRGMIWTSPYVQSYTQPFYYGPDEDVEIRSLPQDRPPFAFLSNELAAREALKSFFKLSADGQSKIKGFGKKVNGRFFYGSTFNNPFYRTATFTITSTVTTLDSVIICVPSNNLKAIPSPTCVGRKKREYEDFENQFPIVPSKTQKVITTALPPSPQPMLNDQHNLDGSLTSIVGHSLKFNRNSRDKRLFGISAPVASTTMTHYSFLGVNVTSSILLDPTGGKVALCIPAGYVVC